MKNTVDENNIDYKTKIDSLKQQVIDNRGKDYTSVEKACMEIIEIAHDDSEALGFAYFYLAEKCYAHNAIDDMFDTIVKALSYLNQSEQWRLVARAYNLMAITSVTQGNTVAALEYYMSGLTCCNEHDITDVGSSIEINLGYLYMDTAMYKEAKKYFESAYERYINTPDDEKDIRRLTMIYTNLADCHMLDGELDKTAQYIEKIKNECKPHFGNMDYIYVDSLLVRFSHLRGDEKTRDKYIDDIEKRLGGRVMIMDVFDDLYDFCLLMLEIDRDAVVEEIINEIKEPIKKTRIANLKRKYLELKIKLYRKHGCEQECMEAMNKFFDLSIQLEKDKQKMIATILRVRNSIDTIKQRQRELEKEAQRLLEKAETDQLTGIANRYRMSRFAQEALDRCRDEHIPLSYEILDIDYFKQYNDEYGHQAGDNCVKTIAGLLAGIENENIFCARYGGDEFVIVYAGLEAKEVEETAERLRQQVYDLNMAHNGSSEHSIVTISQGICHDIPYDNCKDRDFLHAADEYLYIVKKRSKNAICIGNLKGEEIHY